MKVDLPRGDVRATEETVSGPWAETSVCLNVPEIGSVNALDNCTFCYPSIRKTRYTDLSARSQFVSVTCVSNRDP